ncbi:MAG: hypothetical protein AAFU70_02745, partial [Planctomycetota bacterium]
REHASVMTFGDTVVVFAGSGYSPQLAPLADAWAFDTRADAWRRLETRGDVPEGGGSKRVAHANGGAVYLFAGYGAGFAMHNELIRVDLDGDTLRFESVEQVGAPPARSLHAFAFDPRSSRFVAALGVGPAGFLSDTWIGSFDQAGRLVWREIESENGPEPRFGFSYGFESESGRLVVHSGQVQGDGTTPLAVTDDLWTLDVRADDPAWEQVQIGDAPPGRRNATFTFDDRRDELLVWCGTADGRTNVPGLLVVRLEDGVEWTVHRFDDAEAPPRRSSGFGFADPNSDAVLLGFGNSAAGVYTDLIRVVTPRDD